MRGARGFVIAAAIAAVAVAAFFSFRGGGDDKSSTGATTTTGGSAATTATKAPEGAAKVLLAYSPEKEEMLTKLIADYNAEHHKVGDRAVFVEGQNWSSGEAERQIAAGTFRPTSF